MGESRVKPGNRGAESNRSVLNICILDASWKPVIPTMNSSEEEIGRVLRFTNARHLARDFHPGVSHQPVSPTFLSDFRLHLRARK